MFIRKYVWVILYKIDIKRPKLDVHGWVGAG
jgi:hypothetical protein